MIVKRMAMLQRYWATCPECHVKVECWASARATATRVLLQLSENHRTARPSCTSGGLLFPLLSKRCVLGGFKRRKRAA
jgi:anti-sigma factor RsiW